MLILASQTQTISVKLYIVLLSECVIKSFMSVLFLFLHYVLVEACKDLGEIRLILHQSLDEFFKLMNEFENEDLVFTLETTVDKFGKEMAPYAIGLCNNLAAAFWKCMNSSEADDDGDDPGALAVVGCFRAISTILESVSSIPK